MPQIQEFLAQNLNYPLYITAFGETNPNLPKCEAGLHWFSSCRDYTPAHPATDTHHPSTMKLLICVALIAFLLPGKFTKLTPLKKKQLVSQVQWFLLHTSNTWLSVTIARGRPTVVEILQSAYKNTCLRLWINKITW